MTHEDGRVTLLPAQIRRLAELFEDHPSAIAIVQYGSVLRINTGTSQFSINANGSYIHNDNQEQLC